MPTCQICGRDLKIINSNHLNQHGMSLQEYIEKYGDPNKTTIGGPRRSTSATSVAKKISDKPTMSARQLVTLDELYEKEKTIIVPETFTWVDQSNPEILDEVIYAALDSGEVAVDTETTGLDPFTDKVTHIILTPYDKERKFNILIPLYSVDREDRVIPGLLPTDYVVSKLKPLLEDPRMRTSWFNLYFDYLMLKNSLGINVANICPDRFLPKLVNGHMKNYDWDPVVDKWDGGWDGSIAAKILNENEESFKLKDLYGKYLLSSEPNPDIKALGADTFEEQFGDIRFFRVPKKVATCYGCKDGYLTRRMEEFQKPYIESTGRLSNVLYTIEYPLVKPLAEMRHKGIYLSLEKAKEVGVEIEKKRGEALEKVVEVIGNINLNSPKQVAHALFVEQGLPDLQKGSTKASVLEDLADLGYDVAQNLIDYKKMDKLKGSFIDPAADFISPDGKVHCLFNQNGTKCITGDALILSSKGLLPLRSFVPDGLRGFSPYETEVVNRYGNLEKTSQVYANGITKTRKLRLGMGLTLEGTLDHRVWIHTKYSWPDHKFPSMNNKYLKLGPGVEDWRRLDEIKVGDYIKVPLNQHAGPEELFVLPEFSPQLRTNSNEFTVPTRVEEDLAEFLGMYIADGSIHTANGTWSMRISNDSPVVIARVKELVKSLFNLEAKTYWAHTTYITSFTSQELGRWFVEIIGLKAGAANKEVPEAIMRSPERVVAHFIRGLTLDSSLDTKKGRIRLKLGSTGSGILNWVHKYLLNIGILGSYIEYEGGYDGLKILNITGPDYQSFIDQVGVIEPEKVWPRGGGKYGYKRGRDEAWLIVKGIDESENPTYDFEVPETHSFIANGLINHNTGRFSSSHPNLQQVPAKYGVIRTMFQADKGKILIGGDFS